MIAVLLTVSIGGYLYLSQSEEDLIGTALQSVSNHLLALVPEQGEKDEAFATISLMEDRLASGEVRPEQMERLAASIMNLRSSGTTLDAGEVDMLVKMALEDPEVLPSPESSERPPPPPPHSRAEMVEAAGRVEAMFGLWQDVDRRTREGEAPLPPDAPPIRFYADNGLKVVVDERLRAELERAGPGERNRMVAWQARLAESVGAESERIEGETAKLVQFFESRRDSLDAETSRQIDRLTMLNKLRSRGVVLPARAESLMVREERAFFRRYGGVTASETAGAGASSSAGASAAASAVVGASN
ncbi:MAG: hypothetical protein HKN29_11910 [Rhodothermales bacterium]|nr:hypothetical protein [Rhodothermales bacterium]